jgi:rhodanese-related sulfurtransferase
MKCWRRSVRSSLLGAFIAAVLLIGQACSTAVSTLPPHRAYASPADVPRVTVEEAKKEVDAGTAIIVDSRGEQAYAQEHIAGSVNIPGGSSDEKFAALPKDKKIFVYCSCASENSSSHLAFQMNKKGIANTYALVGGTDAWARAGFPMEKKQQ